MVIQHKFFWKISPLNPTAQVKLTMDQVRELLGFATRMQVDAFLQQHQVYDSTVQDLEKDMATLDRLMGPVIQPR